MQSNQIKLYLKILLYTSAFINFHHFLKHLLSLLRLSAFFAGPPDKLAEAPYKSRIKMWFWYQGNYSLDKEDIHVFNFS